MNKITLIKLPYYLGIAVDALWAVALFVPALFGLLLGNPDFHPEIEVRTIMAIGGTLMTGWTFLLVWAVKEPVERRVVCLLTAFPVIFGMFIVALVGFLNGNTANLWIIFKTIILIILFINSYVLAGKIGVDEN
jgi:hypothetical protein